MVLNSKDERLSYALLKKNEGNTWKTHQISMDLKLHRAEFNDIRKVKLKSDAVIVLFAEISLE